MAKRNSRKKAARKQHQLRIKQKEDRDKESEEEMVEGQENIRKHGQTEDDDSVSGDDGEDDDVENEQNNHPEEEPGDDSESGSESSDDDNMDIAAVFHDQADGDDDDDDDDSSDSDDKDEKMAAAAKAVASTLNSDQYTFDLRKMLAINSDQLPLSELYGKTDEQKKSSSSDKSITIPLDDSQGLTVNDDFLLSRATEGCTQLIQALWQLPTEQSDAGPLVTLPGYDEIRLPRALVSQHKNTPIIKSCCLNLCSVA
jgi:hypothetical protein